MSEIGVNKEMDLLTEKAFDFLKKLIATPSFSREEHATASLIEEFLGDHEIVSHRQGNNVWAKSSNHKPGVPLVLLNSHHDTVKPSRDWKGDPFDPTLGKGKLTGLGSNDAGASVVSLLASFAYLQNLPELPFKLIVAITAEEEISGKNGVKSILPELGEIDLGIVGEPTGMQMAIAEKGLIVLDCQAYGKAGHAARKEGENALYKALKDIDWFRTYVFEKPSDLLGETIMTVTQIEAGQQHNVVPDECRFVVDIRTNEKYNNEEVIELIKDHIQSEVTPRSYHLNSSSIELDHPIVRKGINSGLTYYGSPTLSDQSMMNFDTIKIGPGKSERSHTAGEFIHYHEIERGIQTYIELLTDLKL